LEIRIAEYELVSFWVH